MQKQEQKASKVSYVVIALLIATYILFPSGYRVISQRVFGVLYTQHAQSVQDDTYSANDSMAYIEHGLVPAFVIARPPQTPYDYLITTVPENQQFMKYKKGIWYVYDEAIRPIGRIEKVYPTLFITTLFSAPGSDEVFSVNNYITRGKGEGGGSFSLQVPIDMAVTVGMPIIHQATGKVVSTVTAAESIPEKNIQKITGVLQRSPFEMATVYVPQEQNDPMVKEPIESAIEAAESIAENAQGAQDVKDGEEGGGEAKEETAPE